MDNLSGQDDGQGAVFPVESLSWHLPSCWCHWKPHILWGHTVCRHRLWYSLTSLNPDCCSAHSYLTSQLSYSTYFLMYSTNYLEGKPSNLVPCTSMCQHWELHLWCACCLSIWQRWSRKPSLATPGSCLLTCLLVLDPCVGFLLGGKCSTLE